VYIYILHLKILRAAFFPIGCAMSVS